MSKFIIEKRNYALSEQTIDVISEDSVKILSDNCTDRKTVQRFRLSIEESLSLWMTTLGRDSEVSLSSGKKLHKKYLRITVKGEQCNPYNQSSEEFGSAQNSMLANIGLIPEYSYNNGENSLTFMIPGKSRSQLLTLTLVILLAALIGVLGRTFLPANTIAVLSNSLIAPIEETVFKILTCIAGPMIFLSVAWGIYGIGDVYTLGRVGKKLMINILLVIFGASVFATFFYPLLGPSLSESSAQGGQLGKFFELILGIFPSDIFSPFVNGNTLQIILLAVVIGLSLIFLGQRTVSVARAIEQINHIITFLMNIVSKLVPYFVFVVLIKLIWSDNFSQLLKVWKFAIVYISAQVLFLILFTGYSSIRQKVNPFKLIKACIPSLMIALTTASSSATFESNMRICREKLGVSKSFSSFGVPFSMVLFKPNMAIYYTLFCFMSAKMFDVKISLSWILITVLITAISAIATPPIPGGSAATYTILFLQLGIPSEALAIAVAIDMVFDFIITSGDMYSLLLEVFNVSSRLGMRNKENTLKN